MIQKATRRQSDRDMPRTPFRNGVTELTKMSGQEYPGLCLLASVCMKGILITDKERDNPALKNRNRDIERRFSLLLFLSLSLEKMFSAETVSASKLMILQKRIVIFQEFARRTIGMLAEVRSMTGLRRPKIHGTKHLAMQIPRFGATLNYFGGFLESHLRTVIKKPTKTTS